MGDDAGAIDERFAALVEELVHESGVSAPTGGRMFGGNALKARGKIFAMLAQDRLVVKLPRARVDALVASRDGTRFDPRRDGRVMKEWLALDPDSAQDWMQLAREALAFALRKS